MAHHAAEGDIPVVRLTDASTMVGALRAFIDAMNLPPGEHMTALCELEEQVEIILADWDGVDE